MKISGLAIDILTLRLLGYIACAAVFLVQLDKLLAPVCIGLPFDFGDSNVGLFFCLSFIGCACTFSREFAQRKLLLLFSSIGVLLVTAYAFYLYQSGPFGFMLSAAYCAWALCKALPVTTGRLRKWHIWMCLAAGIGGYLISSYITAGYSRELFGWGHTLTHHIIAILIPLILALILFWLGRRYRLVPLSILAVYGLAVSAYWTGYAAV